MGAVVHKVTGKKYDNNASRMAEKKVVNPCTSHAHEAAPHPPGREVLFGQHCVGVPESVSDGVGVADLAHSCVPTPPAHSIPLLHVQKGPPGQRGHRREPSIRDGRRPRARQ